MEAWGSSRQFSLVDLKHWGGLSEGLGRLVAGRAWEVSPTVRPYLFFSYVVKGLLKMGVKVL